MDSKIKDCEISFFFSFILPKMRGFHFIIFEIEIDVLTVDIDLCSEVDVLTVDIDVCSEVDVFTVDIDVCSEVDVLTVDKDLVLKLMC